MKRSIFYAIITVSLIAPMNAKADLIGTMNVGTSGGNASIFSSLQVQIYYGTSSTISTPILFDLTLSASDVGNTYTVSSGTEFDASVAMLTNGTDDYMTKKYIGGIGFFTSTAPESVLLTFSDASDPSRVDFSGYNINSMSFTLNSLTFNSPGSNPNGDGNWTDYDLTALVTFDGTVVPVPGAVLLGILGIGVVGLKLRKHA